jgi:hypothetical protein
MQSLFYYGNALKNNKNVLYLACYLLGLIQQIGNFPFLEYETV